MPDSYRPLETLEAIRVVVADRAETQGHVFRRQDLQSWGIDPDLVKVLSRRKWWVRLRHGVYADALVIDAANRDITARHLLDCAASIRGLPLPTFAVAASAGLAHGLPIDRRLLGTVELVRNSHTDVRALSRRIRRVAELPDIHVRTHQLSASDVTIANGVPTVSRPIAAVTVAAQSSEEWALVALDAAAWQSPEILAELTSVAADWPALRGIGTVRTVLPSVRIGAQTALESISRFRLAEAGLPEPELQLPLHDRLGLIGYADLAWRGLGVIGEADGAGKYDSRDDIVREKIREDRIRALGYVVVRWTWNEIFRDSASVAARIRYAAGVAHRDVG